MLVLSVHAKSLQCVPLFVTPWAVACQAPLGFSRQEFWSMLPCPPPGDRPNPGIEPRSSALQGDSLLLGNNINTCDTQDSVRTELDS